MVLVNITNGLSLLPKWGEPRDQSDGERPKGLSRDICTMTTLPLGANMEDLDGFHDSHLDVPSVELLQKCDVSRDENAFVDVRLWVRRRIQLNDIDKFDPEMKVKSHVLDIGVIDCQLADRAKTMGSMKLELSLLEQKLDVAARAMLKRQHDRGIQLFPDKNVRDTNFYKAHVQTISNWKMDKLAPHLSAEEVYSRVTAQIEDQQLKMLHAMVAAAQQDVEQSDVVDPDLMSELATLVEDKHGADDKAGTHMLTTNMVFIWSYCINFQVRTQKTTKMYRSSFVGFEMLPPGASPVGADLWSQPSARHRPAPARSPRSAQLCGIEGAGLSDGSLQNCW